MLQLLKLVLDYRLFRLIKLVLSRPMEDKGGGILV